MNNNSEIRIGDEFVPVPPEYMTDEVSPAPTGELDDKPGVPILRKFVPTVDDSRSSHTSDPREAERILRERDASKN